MLDRLGGVLSKRGPIDAAIVMVAVVVTAVVPVLTDLSRARPISVVLALVASGALYYCRRYPLSVGMTTLACSSLYYPLTDADGPILLTFVVALYSAAAAGKLAGAISLAVAALIAVWSGESRSEPRHVDNFTLFLLAGWLLAAIAFGGMRLHRAAHLRAVEQRVLAAERGREEEARRRATEERLRIARDLHDVLGHNISLISVQASAALHRQPSGTGSGDETRAALAAIKTISKETLRELRAALGILRQVDEDAPTAPAPGLAGLDGLVAGVRAVGPAIRTEIEGEPRPVPADVDIAAFRIVQESLTNVTRHAAAETAIVRIRYGEEDLFVEIVDDGIGPRGEPGGGIGGMRQRVDALGGQLSTGAGPDGGFRVAARLPIGGRA